MACGGYWLHVGRRASVFVGLCANLRKFLRVDKELCFIFTLGKNKFEIAKKRNQTSLKKSKRITNFALNNHYHL